MHRKILILAIAGILLTGVIFWATKKPQSAPQTFKPVAHKAVQPKITTLFFAGDIMLSRNVADRIYKAKDFALPFEQIKDQVSAADISFANLESPFNDKGNHSVEGSLVFNADPQSVAGLIAAGFDILSTANNHGFDQGQLGIDFTQTWLKQNSIIPIGTTPDCHQGAIITKNNIKFGFLAYSYTALNDGGKSTSAQVCDANNTAQITKDIQALKQKSDVVIISLHMGTEYTREPNLAQTTFAHNAVDAGADLVIGAHPHWVQTIEQYHDKWIFYSLGNFVFDQMWSQDTREGLTVTITFNDNDNKIQIQKIELNPVIIDNFCCARWADPSETSAILKKIGLPGTEILTGD